MDVREFQNGKRHPHAPRHPWEQSRVYIIDRLLQQYGLPNRPPLVDIGSGDGYVLQQLASLQQGSRYIGIDSAYADEHLLLELKKNWQYQTEIAERWATIEPTPIQPVHLLLMDVLEHVEMDETFLLNLYAEVPAGSRLFITVPADPSLFGSHDQQLGHYRRYTAKQLQATCENAGWKTIESGGFFLTLWAIRKIQYLLFKGRPMDPAMAIEHWNEPKWKTQLGNLILRTDYQISRFFHRFGWELPGLSRYLICSKPQ